MSVCQSSIATRSLLLKLKLERNRSLFLVPGYSTPYYTAIDEASLFGASTSAVYIVQGKLLLVLRGMEVLYRAEYCTS